MHAFLFEETRLGDTGHGQDQEPSYRSTGNQEVEKNLSQPDSSVNKVKGATADVNESERDREEVERGVCGHNPEPVMIPSEGL